MNVSDQIIAVIETMCDKFGIAINWTSENILPYVEQLCKRYVTYEIATSSALIVVLLAMFVVAFIVTRMLHKKANKIGYYEEAIVFPAIVCAVVTIVLGLVTIGMCFREGNDIITCLTFPEKQILEYVSNLMQSGQV